MTEQPHQPHQPYPPKLPPGPEAQPPPAVNVHLHHHGVPPGAVVVRDNSSIHLFHLILTVLSCGAWAPIWIIHAIVMAVKQPGAPLPPVPGAPMTPEQKNRMALEQAHARIRRRQEARTLAMQDPLTARELMIGRTDMPPDRRPYDDGGLIDVNVVPAQELTRFGLSMQDAERIVRLRAETGGFSSAEDLAVVANLPPHLVPELREYGLFLR
ncbi:ComEA family DNA-binding protein [Thermomonospora cellulosilytica]|uniref:DNA uptake protein ComE-like DNA-binding protein n=1 Tax=Thermomonospora cellulosilytica TaxID=1411118 RepID=A0A7W3N4P6_9ACTN|nr:helix-hairpin-helix domain-containing protein [Thermomonospora cellulosilytica]MBA9007413.1 DNA uptake protein ComE-like DNA-binding protein [Thermomonospora cellulosilytica]